MKQKIFCPAFLTPDFSVNPCFVITAGTKIHIVLCMYVYYFNLFFYVLDVLVDMYNNVKCAVILY